MNIFITTQTHFYMTRKKKRNIPLLYLILYQLKAVFLKWKTVNYKIYFSKNIFQ
jgi:hypothetical protein